MEERLFLQAVLLPAACAAIVALSLERHRARWMGATMALALAISAHQQQGSWPWPQGGAWTWLVVACAASALVSAAGGRTTNSRTGRAIVCGVAAALGSLLLPVPGWNDAASRLALTAAGGCMSALLLPLGMHRGGFSAWCCHSIGLAAPSLVALSCGFAKLAVALASVSAMCGMVGAASAVTRRPVHAGISGTVTLAMISVLGSATAQAFDAVGTPGWVFIVAAIAPLGAWLGEAPPFRGTALVSALARIVGVATIAGLAIATIAPRLASQGEPDAYAQARAPLGDWTSSAATP